MTNGDYIRQMDDRALAEFLLYAYDTFVDASSMRDIQQTIKDYPDSEKDIQTMCDWLETEAVISFCQREVPTKEQAINGRTERIAVFTNTLYRKLRQREFTDKYAGDIVLEVIKRIPIEDLY